MRCGAKEKNKPPCVLILDEEGYCTRHCRALVRTCNGCQRRYEKAEAGRAECPSCGHPRFCAKPHRKVGRRCQNHGGASRKGLSHPKILNGSGGAESRYMGVLSPRSRGRFEAIPDEGLLSLAPDIRLTIVRVEELVERAEASHASAETWREAQAAFEEFATANERRDRQSSLAALTRLGVLLRQGRADYDAWAEVREERKLLKSLVESERRHSLERMQLVQSVIVLRLIDAMTASLKNRLKILPDETANTILDDVSSDIVRLATAVLGGAAEAGAAAGEERKPIPQVPA